MDPSGPRLTSGFFAKKLFAGKNGNGAGWKPALQRLWLSCAKHV
jgi:hypothetical protein